MKKARQMDPPWDYRQWVTPLRIPEGRSGRYTIRHRDYPPGATERFWTPRTIFLGAEAVRVPNVTFPEAGRWHELIQDGQGVWTSDTPIEQRQQMQCTREFKGDVLVTGLGVGLMPVLLASNPNVTSVTVIEISPDVIKLVWKHVARGVRGEKMKVIEGDAFHQLPVLYGQRKKFDYVFHDIWQSDGERTLLTTVLPLRAMSARLLREPRQDRRRVTCWNEDIMHAQVLLGINTRLQLARGGVGEDISPIPTLEQTASPSLALTRAWWRWYHVNGLRVRDMADSTFNGLLADAREYVSTMGTRPWTSRWGRFIPELVANDWMHARMEMEGESDGSSNTVSEVG